MKTAVYRTSDDSALVGSLIECAEDGKQSVCLVELKARFDERRNIEWSRALEQAGVHVVYGFPDLKIHAKMTLIVRREGDELRRYAHIGTGNYHSATARLYEDVGIFTADEEIAADVADLFNFITGFGKPHALPEAARRAVHAAQRARGGDPRGRRGGRRGRARAHPDQGQPPGRPALVDELYLASQAGAQIDIIARTTCALRPGVEGLSENIRVRSIVGRFLEHSRIYSFEAGDGATTYIGSADLMQRNLDHRIEVLVPVENARIRQEVHTILDSALADDTNAWLLDAGRHVDAGDSRRQASLPPRDDDAAGVDAGPAQRPRSPRRLAQPTTEATMPPVNVAIIDVGSNTAAPARRLGRRRGSVGQLHRERVLPPSRRRRHALGRIGEAKLVETERSRSGSRAVARKAGAERLETIVTAPGRQAANSKELVECSADATRRRSSC